MLGGEESESLNKSWVDPVFQPRGSSGITRNATLISADSRTAPEDVLRLPERACAVLVSRRSSPGDDGAAVLFSSNAINFQSELCPDLTATLSPTQWTLIPSR